MAAERTPAGTEYFSAHIEQVRKAMATLDVNDEEAKVEAEIEASKAHWSELSSAYYTAAEGPATESPSSSSQSERASEVEGTREWSLKVAEENLELFRSLKEQYPGGFFWDDDDVGSDPINSRRWFLNGPHGQRFPVGKVELSSEKPFAEGAQAELFHAHPILEDGSKVPERLVVKVFKEGTSLKDLLRLLPPTMLTDRDVRTYGVFGLGTGCSAILGAQLLKSNGRFAFLMARAWGDLRKLIDIRMAKFDKKGPPFENNVAIYIMYQIALGMRSLHKRDIIHRDLKAANVLLVSLAGSSLLWKLDPNSLEPSTFGIVVADYECSVGVIGTRFWRAPEILHSLKNRSIPQNPKVFSKQSDVYSFGMTCYEILSGGIPFEELQANEYDGVIGGNRPTLPKPTLPWLMDLVNSCWHKDPLMRPSFEEIVKILKPDEIAVEENL